MIEPRGQVLGHPEPASSISNSFLRALSSLYILYRNSIQLGTSRDDATSLWPFPAKRILCPAKTVMIAVSAILFSAARGELQTLKQRLFQHLLPFLQRTHVRHCGLALVNPRHSRLTNTRSLWPRLTIQGRPLLVKNARARRRRLTVSRLQGDARVRSPDRADEFHPPMDSHFRNSTRLWINVRKVSAQLTFAACQILRDGDGAVRFNNDIALRCEAGYTGSTATLRSTRFYFLPDQHAPQSASRHSSSRQRRHALASRHSAPQERLPCAR